MKNLLKFYIPFVFSQIAICSAGLFILFGLLSFLDPEMFLSSFISVLIIFFIFPCFVYFRKKIYLPGGLNWILLTPVKKTHIIYANFLINLLKLILIMSVSFLAYGTFVSELSLGEYLKYIFVIEDDYSAFVPSVVLVGIELFVAFLWVFVAGVFNVIVEPKSKDYKQSKNLLKDWKFIGYSLVALTAVLIIKYFWDSLRIFVPSFLMFNFAISTLVLFWFYLTFTSVKIQVKNKTLVFLSICIPFALLSIYFLNLTRTMNSPIATAEDKLEEAIQLGVYSIIYEEQLQKVLTGPVKTLSALREIHLTEFFMNKANSPFFENLLSSFKKECAQEKNVACRLEGYLTKVNEGSSPIELARTSCPLDPQSCYILLIHEKATQDDIAESTNQLTNICKDYSPKDKKTKKEKSENSICCGCFQAYLNKRDTSEKAEFLVNSRKSSKIQYRR